MNTALQMLDSVSPVLLIAAGVALLIVPKFIRWAIALGLIFLGAVEMYPELLATGPQDAGQQ